MSRDVTASWAIIVIAVLVGITVGPAIWVVRSRFEAQAYNRVTGAHVSTWDAMWLDLRVMESPRPAEKEGQ